jgi:lysophospholipase L1-like esterase
LPGAGHLNADGNRLIAAKIAEALRNRFGDER